MTKRDDGGSAFPWGELNDDGSHYQQHPGLSVRDWFAGQALSTFLAHRSVARASLQEQADVAMFCYSMADAMLAARKGGSDG